ncbi:UDP-N-acetylmuramoyl-L-alanyl-D-glutamate--2,6-diaminopimelate ligase [Ekhidna sp.]|jgi:UDP-N-acetylmuramoyl-L-alanyl-D-glutamate--2,6-diaminopimelate ligase|uniref:UDP-N-acetylmuramoyl-L-alanyl-D-glutamate--2, 6-diaminopimelate ligase n=1 Tax=Ekhidna sp. TaxID=2608089 RepID=UPI0032EACED8
MQTLKDILFGVSLKSITGNRDEKVTGITFDSRKVEKGSLFVAVKGLTVDGHDFIHGAIEKGARVIVCEEVPESLDKDITVVQTDNSAKALGIIASNFYGRPSEKLKLVGITGTNGKTTCATLLFELFQNLGYSVGLLSTVENKINHKILDTSFTTPDAVQLNQLLAEMVESGCTHAFMEVSSHALVQNRVAGIHFTGGVFTNISHDHLDYHKTFDEYIAAKKLLFDGLTSEAFALVNVDDKRGAVMLQNTKGEKNRMGIRSMADYRVRIIHNTLQGLELNFDGVDVWFKLIGEFNAYNLLTSYAVAILLGEEKEEVLSGLSTTTGASGRFEKVENTSNVMAIVDYAHTPDALENVLQTIDDLRTKNETLVTVVGCGGDRDKTKRPKMAGIAARFSDKVILTSDNPRTEDPQQILEDMKDGIPKSKERNVMVIADRKEAIRTACNLVNDQDIILVAGKGHETYQEINGTRHHFDDREVLKELLN